MMPDLESLWWISAMGAICSYTYSAIALGLSCYKLSSAGVSPDTTLFGVAAETPTKRAFGMFQALGNVALAWTCAMMVRGDVMGLFLDYVLHTAHFSALIARVFRSSASRTPSRSPPRQLSA